MKKLFRLLIISLIGLLFVSLNSVSTTDYHTYATVDTDPGAPGYYTGEVSIRRAKGNRKAESVYFSNRGTGSMTVTLQYKCDGDAGWTDYSTYTTVTRVVVEGGAVGELWRAGVVNSAAYTSGSMTFGFDW